MIVFPKTFELSRNLFVPGNVILVRGRLSLREDEDAKVVAETVEACPQGVENKKQQKRKGAFLRFPHENDPRAEMCLKLLSSGSGELPVYLYYEDTKKYVRTQFTLSDEALIRQKLEAIAGKENVVVQ